jgi:hypothetical protein
VILQESTSNFKTPFRSKQVELWQSFLVNLLVRAAIFW